MYQSFDKFLRSETPDFYLCNPDETIISQGTIPATDRRCVLKFNDISEISFQVADSYLDYDKIQTRKLILVNNIGYFQIQTVQESDSGAEKYKEVTAYSLQNEFTTRRADIDNGTYRLYNNTDPSDTTTLLGILAPKIIGWTISEVDADLWDTYRTFDDLQSDISIYNFLVDSISNAYECVVVFDFLNKTIAFKVVSNITQKTSIYLSFQNLLNTMTVTEESDEIKTVLYCYGQDLDISEVNPLGTKYIIDLDYYANSNWMSPDLISAYNAWKTKLDLAHTNYVDLRASENDVITLMVPLQTEYQVMVPNRDIKENARIVGLANGSDVSSIIAEIAILDGQISSKNAEIASKQGELDTLRSNINNIIDSVSLESNFTENQLSVLKRYFIEDSYTNENIIVTDTMTFGDIQDRAQTLYNQSKEILSRISQPRYTFEADSENFLQIKEFQQFANELELGCVINVERSESNIIYPILLQINFNWDDPKDFSLTFGNRYSLNDAAYVFADLTSEAIRNSQSVSASWVKLNQYNTDRSEINSFINSALNASRNNIISSTNQEMVIDASGLTARQWNENSQDYDDKQLKIINNMIVFTDDKWNTVRTALGEIFTMEGDTPISHGYGIAGEVILGKLIAGDNLKIANENNSFIVDGSGATLTNANFVIENNTNKIVFNPTDGLLYQSKHWDEYGEEWFYNDIFYFDNNGNLTMKGNIHSHSGNIGGFNIKLGALYYPTNHNSITSTNFGMYIGTNGINIVNSAGTSKFVADLSKSELEFTGKIICESGSIGGFDIANNSIYANNHHAIDDNLYAGVYIGSNGIDVLGSGGANRFTANVTTGKITVKGEIISTSGSVGAFLIDNNSLVLDSGRVYSSHRDLYIHSVLSMDKTLVLSGGSIYPSFISKLKTYDELNSNLLKIEEARLMGGSILIRREKYDSGAPIDPTLMQVVYEDYHNSTYKTYYIKLNLNTGGLYTSNPPI